MYRYSCPVAEYDAFAAAGGHDVLVRAKLILGADGVTMQINVRSTDEAATEVLAAAVG